MSQKPVNFNLPDRVIGAVSNYCMGGGLKAPDFFRATVKEYTHDLKKLADAVSSRVLSSLSAAHDDQIRRVTHRVEVEDISLLRRIAKNADMTFEGMTRIIIEDKINSMKH